MENTGVIIPLIKTICNTAQENDVILRKKTGDAVRTAVSAAWTRREGAGRPGLVQARRGHQSSPRKEKLGSPGSGSGA